MEIEKILKDWGALIGYIFAFLIFPATIMGILAGFGIEFEVAMKWTGSILGIIYGITGIIAIIINLVKATVKKEIDILIKKYNLKEEENKK